jgi:hypothetical protein
MAHSFIPSIYGIIMNENLNLAFRLTFELRKVREVSYPHF